MSRKCTGEIHFIGEDGKNMVEFIDEFAFPKRAPDEHLDSFKEKVTKDVLLAGLCWFGHEVTAVKWIGLLGYHQGYVDPRG